MEQPFLSVVIPAFNEDRRIDLTLERVVSYLGQQDYSWEVLVVDDGSTDETSSIAEKWTHMVKEVRLEKIPHGGKGWAVKNGMIAATGNYRFMCDADLAMPIEQLETFIDRINDGHDIVIGSRQISGARRFGEPLGRHIMGRVFNWTVNILAVRGFEDTQCGFKCFHGDVAEELFGLQQSKGFGFDVEILYIARKRGISVLEVPIDWYHQQSSKVRPVIDSMAMVWDSFLVRLRDMRGMYDQDTDC